MDPLVEGEAHCAAEGCGRLDFLPFACDACGKLLCLSHRLYEAHECVRSGASETVVCPLCAQAVRLVRGEDPNVTHARHVSSGQCVADNYKRVHKKPRCACKGCKALPTFFDRPNFTTPPLVHARASRALARNGGSPGCPHAT